ncbi:MAG: outer membrane protein assembly factor BamE [Methylacidiphilales bacterium]|nr:outer membrane protein assembly factor BamE [Candidatus Methylacidiphilales bacterium]
MTACRLALITAAVVLLAGCSRLTEANLEKIHNGMTTDEVKAILGPPSETESSGALGITGTTYSYHSGSSDVKITFLNDKVIATEGQFK